MKTYVTPLMEVAPMSGMTVLMDVSPNGDIQGNPPAVLNEPEMAPRRRPF